MKGNTGVNIVRGDSSSPTVNIARFLKICFLKDRLFLKVFSPCITITFTNFTDVFSEEGKGLLLPLYL